jgi:hypothetical protein
MMSVSPCASGTPLETITKTAALLMGGRKGLAACREPQGWVFLLSKASEQLCAVESMWREWRKQHGRHFQGWGKLGLESRGLV